MVTELERVSTFEREWGWKKVLALINLEFTRKVGEVKRLARESGKDRELGYALGFAEGIEWVSKLPEIMRKELARQQEKTNVGSTERT